jgi:nucleoside-diphosphate-sugar epimerase
MTKRAAVVGATGQIGRAAVRSLARDGWEVVAVSRGPRADVTWPEQWGVRAAYLDRSDEDALAAALAGGCEVLVDCVAYDAQDAARLLRLSERVGAGSAVVVSSAAVYRDDNGWSFDTQDEHFPRYPVPLTEEQPTVQPGDATYATRKVALEQTLLAAADRLPVTLLRAGAIHGPGSPLPREWYVVKRALDGREVRLLPYRGESRFHTIAAANLGELVRLAAARPGAGPLNAGDPEALTAREIAAAIDEVLGHKAEEVLVDGPIEGGLGESPWSIPEPLVLDMSRAERVLGYRAVAGYREAVREAVEWLVAATSAVADWREALPGYERYLGPASFDYEAEDRWLARHR